MKAFHLLPVFLLPLFATFLTGQTVAVVTAHVADPDAHRQLRLFQNQLTAQLAEAGFEVRTSDTALQPVEPDPEASPRLSPQDASALEVGRQIGADLILFATIDRLSSEVRQYEEHGVQKANTFFTAAASYRLMRTDGSTVDGGTLSTRRGVRGSQTLQTSGDLAHQLVVQLAWKIGAEMTEKKDSLPQDDFAPEPLNTEIQIRVLAADLKVPEVIEENGRLKATGERAEMEVAGVNVEIEGVVAGSATGTINAPIGIRRVRLSRDGFEDWQRLVNIHEGMELTVGMRFTDEERNRWKDTAAFLEGLVTERILTEAEADRMRKEAEALRSVDIRYDVNVFAEAGPIRLRHLE